MAEGATLKQRGILGGGVVGVATIAGTIGFARRLRPRHRRGIFLPATSPSSVTPASPA